MRISDWSSDVCSSDLYTQTDFIVALIATVVSLEATRRIMGITLPALAGVFLLYAVYGNLLPENISHRGYPWGRVLTDLYRSEERGVGKEGVSRCRYRGSPNT